MKRLQKPLTLITALSLMMVSWIAIADDTAEKTQATSDKSADRTSAVKVEEEYKPKTKIELRRMLSPIQYDVTQNEATETAFRNKYWNNKQKGIYKCVVCGRDLFSSDTKFKSGTGWPSFYAPLDEKNIGLRSDRRLFYVRTEVHCERCKAHLGHVFDDGPQPTGKRYCMNSAALEFVKESDLPKTASDSGESTTPSSK